MGTMKRIHVLAFAVVCLVAVLSVAAVSSTVAHETPPPYPPLEPNDEFSQATEIAPRTLHGLQPIKYTDGTDGPRIEATSGFWPIEDRDTDVYAVDLERGDRLPVTLYHYGSDGNLRYTVYDPSRNERVTIDPDGNWQRTGSALTRSDRAIQRGNTTVLARCEGTHYVEVMSDDDDRAPYRLEVDDRFEHNDDRRSTTPVTEGTYQNLAITTYDTDFYAMEVQKGEVIEATINLSTQAHWERSPAVKPVRVNDPVTQDEWAPYNHTRWEDPSFRFRPTIGGPTHAGDYDIRAVNQIKYDELHRDKSSIEITESGTVYFVVRSSLHWTSAIDGAAKWTANAARYNLTISRTGTPPTPSTEASDDGDGDESNGVRTALERVKAKGANNGAGFGVSQLGGEAVNLAVDGEGTYSFDLGERLDMENISGCGRNDATVRLETDEETVREIGASDRPGNAIETAYRRDDIRVDGIGPVNSAKWLVLNGASDVIDWLPIGR